MEDEKNTTVDLFLHADQKIEKVKEEVSEVIRSILSQGQKLDQLSERINEGVSKTAYKTFEKVNEISVALNDMKHNNEKRDVEIHELKNNVEIQRNNWNVFIRVVIFGVVGALLAAIIRFGIG